MKEATASALNPAVSEYLKIWSDCAAKVLSDLMKSRVEVESASVAGVEMPPADTDISVLMDLSAGLGGQSSFRFALAEAARLVQFFSAAGAQPQAEAHADAASAAGQFLTTVSTQVSAALRPKWGVVTFETKPGLPPQRPAITAWLNLSGEDRALAEMGLNQQLLDCLTNQSNLPASNRAADPNQTAPDSFPPPNDMSPSAVSANLDFLMDVELGVALRFGCCQLVLKDILDLRAGSLVELDRHVQDPVDLLLDGKLIARGEVVAIDGNYGLRVTEVFQSAGATENL